MDVEIQDEKHTGRVAVVFGSEQAANAAKQKLMDQGKIKPSVINIVKPDDSELSKKLEPESQGIANTLVKSHVWLGVIGLVVGLIIATILISIGPDIARSSPLQIYIVFIFLGPIIGMMLAGAVSLRPDHDPLITQTVEASNEHRWSVVVQTDDQDDIDLVKKLLESSAIEISETL